MNTDGQTAVQTDDASCDCPAITDRRFRGFCDAVTMPVRRFEGALFRGIYR
jgi:hypothetical protein